MSDRESLPQHAHLKTDRPRGIFTSTDRELILGKKEYESDQSLRNARYRIREHIRHGLLDTCLIHNHLDRDELAKTIQRQDEINRDDDNLNSGFDVGEVLTRLGIETKYEIWGSEPHDFEVIIENMIEDTLYDFYADMSDKFMTRADVDITLEFSENTDEIIQLLMFGEPPLDAVIEYLETGDILLLQRKLREHGEQITPENTSPIDPDDKIFDIHLEARRPD
jgi:hypothetical protein